MRSALSSNLHTVKQTDKPEKVDEKGCLSLE